MSKMILIDEATVTKALEALEAYKGFIDDAHILEGQWHWIDGADNAQAALREALMSGTDGAQSRSDEEQPRAEGTLAQQEHVTDGSPCWCNPELDYKDPDTGAEVWIHKEPQ